VPKNATSGREHAPHDGKVSFAGVWRRWVFVFVQLVGSLLGRGECEKGYRTVSSGPLLLMGDGENKITPSDRKEKNVKSCIGGGGG